MKGKQMETDYNGWKNRETWATNLWIENDEGLYIEARNLAMQALRDDQLNAERTLADLLEEWLGNLLDFRAYRAEYGADMPEGLQIMRDDIGSLYRVDWREIADEWIKEIREDEEVDA